jgi:hypothetical protein
MSGIRALRKLQFGRNADSDSGEAIAATTIWRGTGTIEDARDLHYIAEDVGILVGTDRTNTSQLNAKLSLDATPGTYEQLPHILEMGVKTASPVSDSGGGTGYIYTYTFPTTSPNTIKPYCIQGGDNQQAEVANFMHATDFTLSGNEGKEWMMSANLFGRDVNNTTFTPGLTIPTVYEMNFGQTKLYIDNDSDTWGTTIKSNTLLQASLKYKTGLVPKFTADGFLYFSFAQTTMPDITLTLTFEHDTNSVTEKGFWRTETPRLIRLLNQGAALTTPGLYTYRSMIADLAGKWIKFAKLGERNGNDILEGTFTGRYNDAKASAGSITVVNQLTSLP